MQSLDKIMAIGDEIKTTGDTSPQETPISKAGAARLPIAQIAQSNQRGPSGAVLVEDISIALRISRRWDQSFQPGQCSLNPDNSSSFASFDFLHQLRYTLGSRYLHIQRCADQGAAINSGKYTATVACSNFLFGWLIPDPKSPIASA